VEEAAEDIINNLLKRVAKNKNQQNVIDYNNYIDIVNLVIAYDSSQTTPTVKPTRLPKITPEEGNSVLKNRIKVKNYKENLKRITDTSQHAEIAGLTRFIAVEQAIKTTINSKFNSSEPKLNMFITKENGVNQVNRDGMSFIEQNTTAPGEGGGSASKGGKITKRKKHLKNKTRRKKRVTKNLKKKKGLKKTGKKK
jgi:hypothetical protein